MSIGLELNLLSDREKEILDLAIQGLTDQQIGNQLKITASTVNSYWVRIRGKLGHLSRTELVSKIVQQRADVASSSLNARILVLEGDLADANRLAKNSDEANLLRVAFDANPEACVLFDEQGTVILANTRFEQLFDLKPGTSSGQRFDSLFSTGSRSSWGVSFAQLLGRPKVGADIPLFGVKRGARDFRAMLLVGAANVDGLRVFSCVVRTFSDEFDISRERANVVMESVDRLRGQLLHEDDHASRLSP